jgi:hypothetical protein
MHVVDVLEIAGAITILVAFAAAQAGRLGQRTRSYLILNLLGSGVLAAIAGAQSSWGFLLLEGSWAVVSLIGLLAVLRRTPAGARPGSAGTRRGSAGARRGSAGARARES